MELIAQFEKNECSVLNTNNEIIGKIIYCNDNNRKNCKIEFENRNIIIQGDKWSSQIMENSKIIDNLKIGKFFGNFDLLNSEKKIKGISSLKGGTKMVDNNGETMISIKNTDKILKKNHYIIKSKNSNQLDIFICLYCHILGSQMKSFGAFSNI